MFQVPNQSYVMGSIPQARQGVAGGLTLMVRTSGVVLGVAAANTLFAARRNVHADTAGAADLTDAGVFVASFRDVLTVAALVCAAAAALSLVRPPTTHPPEETRESPTNS